MTQATFLSIQKMLPRIRVHAWGGFGSQLFACLVARRLKSTFPGRKIQLIFHSSGVTLRNLEIPSSFLSEFEYKTINDFVNTKVISGNGQSLVSRKLIQDLATVFLRLIGVLARLNDENEFSKLRPWVKEVRGHYTEINLSKEEVNWISSSLGLQMKQEEALNAFSIHFRLGDLLRLSTKTHISSERLVSAIASNHFEGMIDVYSDSEPREVEYLLKDSGVSGYFLFHNIPTIRVIEKCVFSKYFIGTNSKISLWISILRIVNGEIKTTSVPNESAKQIGVLLRKIADVQQLRAY